MKKYEYKSVITNKHEPIPIDKLNEYGENGWCLVSVNAATEIHDEYLFVRAVCMVDDEKNCVLGYDKNYFFISTIKQAHERGDISVRVYFACRTLGIETIQELVTRYTELVEGKTRNFGKKSKNELIWFIEHNKFYRREV